MEILSRAVNTASRAASGRDSVISRPRSCTPSDLSSPPSPSSRPTTQHRPRTRMRGNRIPFPGEYPPPLPPQDGKDDFCDPLIIKEVDDYIYDAPEELLEGTYPNLVRYLVNDGKWGDVGKARAIFRWITLVDVHGLQGKKAPVDTPMEYFQRIKKGTGNHAHLYAGLCKFADLKCVIVNGINKSAAYEVGEKINRRKMAAQWNAIYLHGAWRFVDAFWASTCIVGRKTGKWTLMEFDGRAVDRKISRDDGREEHRSNDFFFLTDPDMLVYSHFPNDSLWQLLEQPITFVEFEEAAYIREKFFILGMSMNERAHRKCVVDAEMGELCIEVGLPKNSENYKFKYTVYLEETPNGIRSFNDSVGLDNFVLFQQSETFLRYTTRFPIAGTFKVDVYGHDETHQPTLDLLMSYIIRCSSAFTNCQPLPDTPAIGWGVGKKARDLGIHAKSHENGIIESTDGTFEIRLKLDKEVNLNQIILHNTINSNDLQNHAVTRIENGEAIINVRLPAGNSEYALKLYGSEPGNEGEMENVCNYLLRSMAHPPQPSFPKLASPILGEKPFSDKLGVTALTHVNGIIETEDGKVVVQFSKEKGVELSCELTNNDLFEEALRKSVQIEQDEDTARFVLDLDEVGEYGLNIYGRRSDDRRQIFNLYNYLIKRSHDANSERRVLKPLRPPVGLKADVDNVDGKVKKPEDNWTVVTSDRKHKLRIPASFKKVVGELRRLNAAGPHLKGGVKIKRDLDEDVITLDLPADGEYVLNLFEKRGKHNLVGTRSYRVTRDNSREIKDTDSFDREFMSEDAESLDSCSSELRHIVEEQKPKPGPKREDGLLLLAEGHRGENKSSADDKKDDEKSTDSGDESVDIDSDKDKESPVMAKTEEELEAGRLAQEEDEAREAENAQAKQMRRITDRLHEAMKVRGSVDRLSHAISKFVSAGLENEALLAEARRLLELWTLILNLDAGIRTKNVQLIEPALQKAAHHDDNELRNYVAVARRMLEQIRKIERLRHSILKLNQKTIAEIRAYNRPPPAVEQVMIGTFLLLGEDEYNLHHWQWIQSLMGKTGQESVKKRVADFNIDSVPIEIALRGQELFEGFTLNDVRDVSAGAAAFFVWSTGMIDSCINNFKNLGGDLSTVRPKSCRRRPFTMAGTRPGTQSGRRPVTQSMSRPLTQGDVPLRPTTAALQYGQALQGVPPRTKVTQW